VGRVPATPGRTGIRINKNRRKIMLSERIVNEFFVWKNNYWLKLVGKTNQEIQEIVSWFRKNDCSFQRIWEKGPLVFFVFENITPEMAHKLAVSRRLGNF
jgi:hypothetical protein